MNSIDVLCRGKGPVWGDIVVVHLLGPGLEPVAGRVRAAEERDLTVDTRVFHAGEIMSVEVVKDVRAQEILERLTTVKSARLAVMSAWQGPGERPVWVARWHGVWQKDRDMLRQVVAFGHEPEVALRELWWFVSTADRLVSDAFGAGRAEFCFDGPQGRWVNLDREGKA